MKPKPNENETKQKSKRELIETHQDWEHRKVYHCPALYNFQQQLLLNSSDGTKMFLCKVADPLAVFQGFQSLSERLKNFFVFPLLGFV